MKENTQICTSIGKILPIQLPNSNYKFKFICAFAATKFPDFQGERSFLSQILITNTNYLYKFKFKCMCFSTTKLQINLLFLHYYLQIQLHL